MGCLERTSRNVASSPKGDARQHRRSADCFERSRTGPRLTCRDGMLRRKALQKGVLATAAITPSTVDTNCTQGGREDADRIGGDGGRRGALCLNVCRLGMAFIVMMRAFSQYHN